MGRPEHGEKLGKVLSVAGNEFRIEKGILFPKSPPHVVPGRFGDVPIVPRRYVVSKPPMISSGPPRSVPVARFTR